jgi:hypothetical protein
MAESPFSRAEIAARLQGALLMRRRWIQEHRPRTGDLTTQIDTSAGDGDSPEDLVWTYTSLDHAQLPRSVRIVQ